MSEGVNEKHWSSPSVEFRMNACKFITTHSSACPLGHGFGKKKLIEAQKDIDKSKCPPLLFKVQFFLNTTLLEATQLYIKSPQRALCFIFLLVSWVHVALSGFQLNKTTISNTKGQANSYNRLPSPLIWHWLSAKLRFWNVRALVAVFAVQDDMSLLFL